MANHDAHTDHLLNELESIKDLLQGEELAATLADIPLLSDIVDPADVGADTPADARDEADALLDLGQIFEDDAEADAPAPGYRFPAFSLDVAGCDDIDTALPAPDIAAAIAPVELPAGGARPRVRPDYRREVLIQELVDEFIPQIEAALRERLDHLDLETLRAWRDRQ
jgi:hypothetical protein